MIQEFRKQVGQVAAHDIHNHIHQACPGPNACLFEKDEADVQLRFEKKTGIACSRGARAAIEHLLNSGVFQYKQLAIAWRQRALWWDWDELEVKVHVSRMEVAYGWFLFVGGLATFVLSLISLIWLRGSEPFNLDHAQVVSVAFVCLAVSPFAEKYMLRPNRIAKRAKPLLDDFYQRQKESEGGGN